MSESVDMKYGREGKASYLRMVDEGVPAWQAATTYEYVCGGCGGSTLLSAAGGKYDCSCAVSGDRMEVFLILAGRRERMGTLNEIAGVR